MPPRESLETEPLINEETRDSGPFAFNVEELQKLVDPKNLDLLRTYGGPEKILDGLRVDCNYGLKSDEGRDPISNAPFQERQKHFGKNILPKANQQSFFYLVWDAYCDRTLILLSVAALISLALGISEDLSNKDSNGLGWLEGTAILVAVVVVIFTNAINNYQKERQFRKLNDKKDDRNVKLIRDGNEQQISVYEINVGDIMLLEPGDIVAVDGIYLSGHNLTCDESSATGESDAIRKGDNDPFILSGSKITEGVGRIVVIAVGVNSYFGKTMMALRHGGSDETPLQIKLDIVAEQIAKLGVSVALLMLITLVVKYFVNAALSDNFPGLEEIAVAMVSIIVQIITIIVVAVPEGLPMAVTLSLAYATTRMLKDNNLVRVLSACETMGNATAVCSDKTGTLTQNKMTVVTGFLSQETFEDYNDIPQWKNRVNQDAYDIITQGIVVNSSAFEDKDEKGQLSFVGSKTEVALLTFCKEFGIDYRELRSQVKQIKVYPFASSRKTMTTIIKLPSVGTSQSKASEHVGCRIYVKGASEIVLKSCTSYMNAEGKTQKFDDKSKLKFEQIISEYANKALRTICLAYRDTSTSEHFDDDNAPIKDLICLGIVGIQDPLRPGVIESVEKFRKAGVTVRMITGDNLETAKAIAENAGIYTKGVAITGPDFRVLPKEKQIEMLPRLQVLARSSPTDKTIVVSLLKESGEVVAVTGDGTNDGPALKMADVGFSMGIAGTEVAKEASSIILMDDNFNSIVNALRWGRAVNDSVRKFLQFQLTVNIAAVVISFISAVTSDDNESILTAVQLLWINLIMDTLAALALATEPPTDELLSRLPTLKDASLINYRMWKMIIGQAIFQIAVNLTLLHLGPAVFHLHIDHPHDKAVFRSLVFNTFVFLQVFNEINCRRIDDHLNVFYDFFHNHIFIIIQVIVITAQILIIEYGSVAFGTTRLTWYQWLVTILIGSLSIPIGVIIRLIPNSCIPEHILDEHYRPKVSKEKMLWEHATHDIITRTAALKVFKAVRRDTKKV
ncbi:PMCA-type calcium-translocating P-type ATPase [Gigaspora margarita]|uniref:Calcium-transporting ATPase n=1 Tax=Gigaspora margarita TaxID=4874 RepID=A0A8H3X3U4_GIGMA|nr:PMCA-type calcium-translocating P-type ATPase [Gigaspora margarita]